MKKLYSVLFSMVLILGLSSLDVNSQTTMDVEPGVGTLNDAIAGDTITGGARADSNRIYVLKRGETALYKLTGSLSNSGYHLTIVAEDGDGSRPFLQPKTPDGGESSRPFRPKGDLTIKGLHVTGIDDLGGYPERIIRASANDVRLDIEDCWLDGDGQSAIRVDNGGMTIIMRNSIMSNIGNPSDLNNGRGIDDRGKDIDTVIFENCTFFNITSRIIRDDGGWIKYARFNNNTVTNIGQFGITFGEVGKLEMMDNLFMNAGFIPDNGSLDESQNIVGVDSIGTELAGMGITQEIIISHNSFWRDSTEIVPYLNDTTTISPIFNETAMAFITEAQTEATILEDMVEFADGAAFPDSILYYHYTPGMDPDETPFWELPAIPDGKFWHTVLYYDFDYVGGTAVTGSSTGGNLGDPMWTGMWPTSTRDLSHNASGLSAYPIPLEDHANISFSLLRDANVDLTVYNIVGKKVATIEQSRYPAGSHTITWNGEFLETGMYILRMKTGNEVTTAKILKK